MQCRGIGPHLTARGMSHGFSPVAAGTCVYILELQRGGPSILVFVHQRHYSCLGRGTLRNSLEGLAGQ